MSLQRIICEEGQAVHTIDDCYKELGRVRGVILFDDSVDVDTLIAKLESEEAADAATAKAIMDAGIAAGTIHVVPQTTGEYDGGTPHTADGYEGDTRVLWHDYKLSFKDPSYSANKAFYEDAEQRQRRVAWRTETLLHFADKKANLTATDPVEDNLSSTVTWNAEATWRSKNKHHIVKIGVMAEYFDMAAGSVPSPIGKCYIGQAASVTTEANVESLDHAYNQTSLIGSTKTINLGNTAEYVWFAMPKVSATSISVYSQGFEVTLQSNSGTIVGQYRVWRTLNRIKETFHFTFSVL